MDPLQLLGVVLLALPFVVIAVVSIRLIGVAGTLLAFSITAATCAIVWLGSWLLIGAS